MAENISLNVDKLLTRVELKTDDGSVVGYAYANFENPRIILRAKEFADYFSKYDGAKTVAELDADMADKFCYLFGYDCRATLFGVLSPSDRMGGKSVALCLIEALELAFSEADTRRANKRQERIAKHLEKYA